MKDDREAMVARKSELEARVVPLRDETTRCDQRVHELRRERERAAARLNALREVAKRHEGVGQGVRALLDGKDPAVRGLVSDGLAAEGALAKAAAAALGDRWQDVRVASMDDGVRLVAALRASKKGRAAVVPDGVTSGGDVAVAAHPGGEGVRGMLLDLIGDGAPEAMRAMLAPVVVCESLDAARAAWEASGRAGPWRYVTVDGEVLEPGGRVVGGVPEAAGAGLMQTQAEVRALEPKVESLDLALEEASTELDRLRADSRVLMEEIEAAKADLHAQELAIVRAERDAKAHEAELAQGRLRLAALQREGEECERVLADATREDLALDRAAEEARVRREQAREGLLAGEQESAGYRSEVDRATARVTDAKVVAARAKERANAARNASLRLERSVDELRVRRERLTAELDTIAANERDGAARETSLRDGLSTAVAEAEAGRARVSSARGVYDGLKTEVGELEARAKAARSRRDALQAAASKLHLQAREEALAMEHLVSSVGERHHLSLPDVVGEFHHKPAPGDAERQRLAELGRSIERLGEVNLTAIEEYEEQSKRQVFFAEQRADIQRAVEQLEAAIAAMNKESRRRFRETFDAVNEHFQRLFPRLFRGGKGELQLSGSDDLLECGVEIVAQPPGKKLINLEAMSGGEKTLTAVTLLFALFLHRPSPFCLLDEVEAALDEANVMRLVDLVRELTDRSQFIMITHNKRTMSMADVLYGITMQEPGVSKMVSVKVRKDEGRTAVA
ncbi:MAG: AAA family ATPase [Polyangiales bacterium]